MLTRWICAVTVSILLGVPGWAQAQDLKRVGVNDVARGQLTAELRQSESTTITVGDRAVKTRVVPAYPEIALSMGLSGTVQLQAVVRPDGTVKEVNVIGGHPTLAAAAQKAVMRWRYQASPRESVENVKITFRSN